MTEGQVGSEERGSLLVGNGEARGRDGALEDAGSGGASAVQFKTFGLLLVLYVAPLAYALGVEGVYRRDEPLPGYLPSSASVASGALWLAVCLALYAAQRVLARALRWKMNEKVAATHKEDLLRMAYLSGLFCVEGRVAARLDREPLGFTCLLVTYTLAFGVLFELVRHCNIEFTRDCVKNPYALALASFLAVVVAALALNHLSLLVALHNNLGDALALAVLVLAVHVLISAAPGSSTAHWHHWYTAAVGSLFSPFDSLSSKLAQAMLLGIYFHGAALFGIEPCFTPEDDDLAAAKNAARI
mmetsp:Transcript_10597/g.33873  ORF Transcript_10597/g.33873 Transcript_10597/m.33873 type:complete len:301 (+) Transcript_10597:87-989(+)